MKNQRQLLKYRGTTCLNCQQPLDKSEVYCHNCGQENSTKRLTFGDFFNEFFSGIFAYDSRLYRTLRALIFKPGKISKDYIEGKRQRYANPYKFYLSVSIIFFIFWGMTSDFTTDTPASGTVLPGQEDLDSDLQLGLLDDLMAEQKDKSLAEVRLPEEELNRMGFWEASGKKIAIFSKYYQETEDPHPRTALKGLEYTPSLYNRWLYHKTVNLLTFDSELFLSYLFGKLPFIIFFFLPILALIIWLLYVRRPYTYMEHLIFIFHSQTVLFVLFGLGLSLDYLFDTSLGRLAATFGFLFYLYKAMRHFYGQGRVKTFLKFLILNGLFSILALMATLFSIFASFAIF